MKQTHLDSTSADARRVSSSFPSLDDAPMILTLDEVASILRCSPWTVRRGVQEGTFRPPPFARRPFRFMKADLIAELSQQRSAAATHAAAEVLARKRARKLRTSKPTAARRRRA